MKRIVLLVLLVLLGSPSKCQQFFNKNFGISLKTKGGILIAHRPVMAHLVQEHTLGFELSLVKRCTGKEAWEQQLKSPKYGVSLLSSTAGNAEIIGHVFALHSFIDLPVLGNETFYLSTRLAGGLGWVSRPFDQQSNPKNVAIGSRLNGFVQLGAHLNYEKNKHHFAIGFDMSHFSNGAAKLPNLGLNLPYISLGYTRFNTPLTKEDKEFTVVVDKRWKWIALGFLAPKQVFPTGGRTSPVFGLSSFFQRQLTPLSGIEFGLDLVSNQSHFNIYKEIEKTQLKVLQIGVYSGYLFQLNRKLCIYTGFGAYLKNSLNPAGYIYNRLGVRYVGKKRLVLNLGIKANFAKADYFEYGIGYRLR